MARTAATIREGKAYIHASYNNIMITATDLAGNTVGWSTAGKLGFKGSRKNTPHAAQEAGADVGGILKEKGVKTIDVFVNGAGQGRDSALRALHAAGLEIRSITDVTPLPHNGCRPRKKRRV